VATVPWTTGRLLKTLLGEATAQVWRDPSGGVVLLAVVPHEGWIGHPVGEFEKATSARVGVLTRFGTGSVPAPSALIQAGDALHLFVPDNLAEQAGRVAATAPDGGR
jgi:trk system potassium uptake protein TrkA